MVLALVVQAARGPRHDRLDKDRHVVVALLKAVLGADPALGTMIEGDVLNDGSAVVVSFIMSWIKFDGSRRVPLAREGDLDVDEPFPVWGSGWIEFFVLVLQMACSASSSASWRGRW